MQNYSVNKGDSALLSMARAGAVRQFISLKYRFSMNPVQFSIAKLANIIFTI